ncbi:oxalurate catabolism protein HpxZ [Calothrix sp. UHCC 0171]|uniref:oxalurate catabolism protein HpxZ n=1 Tax=Calothrix sp. UHCC 0171 TaxID=3110245 RepID=UPI002B21223D|nr:oxalurate catabolism protein HpxZ [Calothrix sp. UHCC 0171]MEA5570948.1 oxalurate catabolism protein HpxZ [Calothrix sp. UHCC 0171]
MVVINNPTLVAELTDLYLRYEDALCHNKLDILNELFWNAPEVVRFGITENLYGGDEISKFRATRPDFKIDRQIYNLKVVVLGQDFAAITLEFRRIIDGIERRGRQSQMWFRLPEGWKIVSAHVSLLPI